MKTLVLTMGALLVIALGRPAAAHQMVMFGPPIYSGGAYAVPPCLYPGYGYPAYSYYPYPLPPAPSLGFGRGGIYGHVFVGRGEGVTSYTLPGYDGWNR
jgi:hypothetical protein